MFLFNLEDYRKLLYGEKQCAISFMCSPRQLGDYLTADRKTFNFFLASCMNFFIIYFIHSPFHLLNNSDLPKFSQ